MKKTKEPQTEIKKEPEKTNKPFPFPFAKKSTTQTEAIEKLFPKKNMNQNQQQEEEEHDCSRCDNAECKCNLIMENISKTIDLSDQIGHEELHNIMITIITVLRHLRDHEDDLLKIMKVCQEVYKDLSPKEMGHTLN